MRPFRTFGSVVAMVASIASVGACDALLGIESLEVVGSAADAGSSTPDARDANPEDTGAAEVDSSEPFDSGDELGDGNAGCVVQTTNAATAGKIETSGGGNGWSNLDNLKAEDNVGAEAAGCCSGDDSQILTLTQFGFSIPTTAQIRGVRVQIRAKQVSGPANWTFDRAVKLVPDEGGGQNLLNAATYNTTYETRDYGSPTTLWGLSLTPQVVNSPAFGVLFRTGHKANAAANAQFDVIRVTVFYCQ